MKNKILFICLVVLFFSLGKKVYAQSALDNLVGTCAASAGDEATYLKDFKVELGPAEPGHSQPVYRASMFLSKNTQYRFSVCNAPSSNGKAILQLFDTNKLIASSFVAATKKDYPYFDFTCTKTGIYHVFISIIDGKPGQAVGVISFIKKI
jgi:hypothetical protein